MQFIGFASFYVNKYRFYAFNWTIVVESCKKPVKQWKEVTQQQKPLKTQRLLI